MITFERTEKAETGLDVAIKTEDGRAIAWTHNMKTASEICYILNNLWRKGERLDRPLAEEALERCIVWMEYGFSEVERREAIKEGKKALKKKSAKAEPLRTNDPASELSPESARRERAKMQAGDLANGPESEQIGQHCLVSTRKYGDPPTATEVIARSQEMPQNLRCFF